MPCGVDLILGINGYIWVSKHVKENQREGEEGFDAEAVYSNQNDVSVYDQLNVAIYFFLAAGCELPYSFICLRPRIA